MHITFYVPCYDGINTDWVSVFCVKMNTYALNQYIVKYINNKPHRTAVSWGQKSSLWHCYVRSSYFTSELIIKAIGVTAYCTNWTAMSSDELARTVYTYRASTSTRSRQSAEMMMLHEPLSSSLIHSFGETSKRRYLYTNKMLSTNHTLWELSMCSHNL